MELRERNSDLFNADNNNDDESCSTRIQVKAARKPFLGGFRHKKTGLEFHHASSQTAPILQEQQQIEKVKTEKTNRGSQITPSKNKYQQTNVDVGSQTEVRVLLGLCSSSSYSHIQLPRIGCRELTARAENYQTADEFEVVKNLHAIVIQRAVRKWLTTRIVMKAKRSFMETEFGGGGSGSLSPAEMEPDVTEENKEAADEEEYDKMAYRQMLLELELRQQEESAKAAQEDEATVRRKKAKEVARAALEMAKQAAVKQQERVAENDALLAQLVVKAGQPRIWMTAKKKPIEVETPTTERAKVFANAYLELVHTLSTEVIDDRVDALKAVLDILDNLWDCPEKRELLSLIAREADLANRDVKAKNLYGLRRRIAAAFLRLLRSPDFNPEIARFEKQLPLPLVFRRPRTSGNSGNLAEERCLGCLRQLPRGKFPLSSGAVVGRCCSCERLDRAARSRQDISVFRDMLEAVKKAEEGKGNTTSPIFQIQASDLRYIVENFWASQSVLSGHQNSDLHLVRWNVEEEWAPWNCVLLTAEEVEIHSGIDDLVQAYGVLLIKKVKLKHALARNHFSKQSTMVNYFCPPPSQQVAEDFSVRGTMLHEGRRQQVKPVI